MSSRSFRDHTLGMSAFVSVSMAGSVGATLTILSSPGAGNRIRVKSLGLIIQGGNTSVLALHIVPDVSLATQFAIQVKSSSAQSSERRFLDGIDCPANVGLFLQQIEASTTPPTFFALNVEYVILTD